MVIRDDILALWDALADYPAWEMDAALDHLLATLCTMVDAHDAYWIGAVRVDEPELQDPYHGWRPLRTSYLNREPRSEQISQRLTRAVQRGENIDPIAVQIRYAGHFRVHTLRDIMPAAFFDSEHFDQVYRSRGINDTLFAVFPLNADTEAYYGFHRTNGEAYSPEEYQLAGTALRAIRWFHRQLFLSHGLLIAQTPLSPAHRRVLHCLLTRDSEATIAEKLELTPATVHTYVRDIYRGLGVRSRAALTALWLGRV